MTVLIIQVQDENGVYGTVMICPSVTPYGRSNPSFRVFTMDSSTYQLQGYQQYHLNLTLANGRGMVRYPFPCSNN